MGEWKRESELQCYLAFESQELGFGGSGGRERMSCSRDHMRVVTADPLPQRLLQVEEEKIGPSSNYLPLVGTNYGLFSL